jgi:1,4-dihydroxy-6-naphthoate synthase
MKLSIGFSPCPNDTFIFDALVNGKLDTGELVFKPVLEDVETLNKWALQGKLDITKLSFPAYFRTMETYQLLNSGSALGKGVGPLLVSLKKGWVPEEEINDSLIALPGENTTANLLFSYAYPSARQKKFMVFSSIEDAVINGEADLGVIIHENRFTYQQKGLQKVKDLGEYWEEKMNTPIPLGGIVAKRALGEKIISQADQLIRDSLRLAFKNYPALSNYVNEHSQSMSETVMRQHIDLYVNDFSLDLGEEGHKAVNVLREVYASSVAP